MSKSVKESSAVLLAIVGTWSHKMLLSVPNLPSSPSSPFSLPHNFSKLITDTASSGGSSGFLVSAFQRLYGSQTNPNIVRYNDFSDISGYFIQKVNQPL